MRVAVHTAVRRAGASHPDKAAWQVRLSATHAEVKARVERVMLIKVKAWDVNCPQHIPQKIDPEDVRQAIESREARIAELEAEVKRPRVGS